MRALLATSKPAGLAFAHLEQPKPGPGSVLVDVHAISLNRGELHRLDTAELGWRPGWDFAGFVATVGDDVNGFAAGQPVVGLLPEGAWAESVVAPTTHLALIGDLPVTTAAALPVAGVTALRLLRLAGHDLEGAEVLVMGAAGGVGRVAVQLAAAAGARVTAVVGSPARAEGMHERGAAHVTSLQHLSGAFDLVLGSVGGKTLEAAFALLKTKGTLVSFGNSSRQATTFDISDIYPKQVVMRCYHLLMDLPANAPGPDLALLVNLVAEGTVTVDVAAVLPWHQHSMAIELLRSRQPAGKVVLSLRGQPRAKAPPASHPQTR